MLPLLNRRAFIRSAVGVLVAAPLAVAAQQTERIRRIGILSVDPPVPAPRLAMFSAMLVQHGWIEGKNFIYEQRYADRRDELLPELAEQLVGLEVDVIIAMGNQAPMTAKRATTRIPIVIWNAGDAVELGLVSNLARPGGNITGVSLISRGLSAKRVQIVKEMLPKATRISLLLDKTHQESWFGYKEAEEAAKPLGIQIQSVSYQRPEELDQAFESLLRQRPDALMTGFDTLSFQLRKRIVELASANRLPAMYVLREYVDIGGLAAYGASVPAVMQLTAAYVDKILRGAKPGDLPIEQPTKVELVINVRTANALGLTIPQALLLRADEVIR